jgi:ubiquinone/menaquinone biosynthesis C-methylase UbiE
LPALEGCRCLDAGCGRGYFVELLIDKGATEIVGIDFESDNIYFCKRRGLRAEFKKSDIRGIPFKKESFDFVLCLEVLTHLPKSEREKALRELYQKTSVNGSGIISFHNSLRLGRYGKKGVKSGKVHIWPESETGLRKELNQVGFKVVEVKNVGFFNNPPDNPVLQFLEEFLLSIPVIKNRSITLMFLVEK